MNRPDRLAGAVLVALGVLLFLILRTGVGGEAVVVMIGAVFLVVYAVTKAYGFLVPGGILTGLGTGIILEAQGADDGVVVLGLAAGFLAIAGIDLLVRGPQPGGWWPLVPGGILAVVGLSELEGGQVILRWWPLTLVAVGLWLLLGAGGRRHGPPSAPSPPSDGGLSGGHERIGPPPPPSR